MSEEKIDQVITLCLKHAEAMSSSYILTEVPGSFGKGKCQMCGPHYGKPSQYEYESISMVAMRRALERQKTKIDMGGTKDKRARAKEPFRDW